MTEYFDFRDGNGDVPAHRHPNGGGWVANTAYVALTAYVGPDAKVFNYAQVFDDSKVFDYAQVRDNSRVSDNSQVFDRAEVLSYAQVSNNARVFSNARVHGIVRSDGYTFVYVPDNSGVMKVQAGCRDFTMEEAKFHWRLTRSGTPLGDETMEILKSLKRLSKFRPEGCV
jgi:hypothetical protein